MAKTRTLAAFVTSTIFFLSFSFFTAPLLVSCGSKTESLPYADTLENRKKWGKLYLEFFSLKGDKKYDEAEKLIVEMEKYQPSSGPSSRGEIAFVQGKFEEADRQVLEAIKLEPESFAYWETAAVYAYRLGHTKEAMERATKAIDLKGKDGKPSTAYLIRGMIYRQEKQFQKALAEFDECLKVTPDDVEASYFKGACLDALGKSDQALAAFNEALRWEPNLQSAIKRRLAIYMRRGDKANARKELALSETQAKSKIMASKKDYIPSDLSTDQVKNIVQNPKAE